MKGSLFLLIFIITTFKIKASELVNYFNKFNQLVTDQILETEELNLGMSGAKIFKLSTSDNCYVLRINKREDSDESWKNQLFFQRIASDIGISPRLFYADEDEQVVLMSYIENSSLLTHYMQSENQSRLILKIVEIIKQLHSIKFTKKISFNAYFPIKEMSEMWSKLKLVDGIPAEFKEVYYELIQSYPKGELVLSHNDLNPNNFLYDGKKIYLIDWETAGWNHPFYDLATLSLFFQFDNNQLIHLLKIYLNRKEIGSDDMKLLNYFRRLSSLFGAFVLIRNVKQIKYFDRTITLEETLRNLFQGKIDLTKDSGKVTLGLSFFNKALILKN